MQPDNPVFRVPLPATWDQYAANLSGNVRSTFGRKLRKLEREHSTHFERIEDAEQLHWAMHTLFDLHNSRWRDKNGKSTSTVFSDPRVCEFHLEVAREMLRAGMLDLRLLKAGDEVIGARYSFEHGNSKSFYASGYRPDEKWARYSLGAVMDFQSIRDSIERGFEYEDLLRNEGEYKARYAPEVSTNQRLFIFRSRAVQTRAAYLGYQAYYGLRRTARRMLKHGD